MEQNVGGMDRNVRFLVGAVLLAAGLAILGGMVGAASQTVGIVLAVLGVVAVGTGATKLCLLYKLIGVDTCSR